MSDVQCSLVLLPVSGKGVLAHVDGWGLLHGVDQEIADCGRVGGVRVGVCVKVLLYTVVKKQVHAISRVVARG